MMGVLLIQASVVILLGLWWIMMKFSVCGRQSKCDTLRVFSDLIWFEPDYWLPCTLCKLRTYWNCTMDNFHEDNAKHCNNWWCCPVLHILNFLLVHHCLLDKYVQPQIANWTGIISIRTISNFFKDFKQFETISNNSKLFQNTKELFQNKKRTISNNFKLFQTLKKNYF